MIMARLVLTLSLVSMGAAAMVFLTSVPASAKDAAQPQFASVKGHCLRILIGDQDLTKACSAELGRSLHGDGRSGLYFFMGATHIITFTGIPSKDTSRDKSQIETIKLDEIILNDGNTKSGLQRIGANGTCNTTQVNTVRFLVSCTGTMEKGTKFSASFEIDKSLK